MACSLIVVKGVRKCDDSQAMEFARIAGLQFIRLQHIKGAGIGEHGCRGFQSVEVGIETDRDGGKSYKYTLSTDRFTGKACMGQRQLLFTPEKHTGMLTADLPDTEYNRSKLVKCYFNYAQWRIVDPILDAEIRRIAEEFQKSLPNKPSKETVIKSQQDEIAELRAQNEAYREKLKINAAADEAIQESLEPSDDDTVGVLSLDKAKEKKLRETAKKEVYAEKADEIAALQDSKGKAWAATKEYRETIAPLIEVRYQKKLEELYAEHAGVAGNN